MNFSNGLLIAGLCLSVGIIVTTLRFVFRTLRPRAEVKLPVGELVWGVLQITSKPILKLIVFAVLVVTLVTFWLPIFGLLSQGVGVVTVFMAVLWFVVLIKNQEFRPDALRCVVLGVVSIALTFATTLFVTVVMRSPNYVRHVYHQYRTVGKLKEFAQTKTTFRIADLTNFQWDRVCVFYPRRNGIVDWHKDSWSLWFYTANTGFIRQRSQVWDFVIPRTKIDLAKPQSDPDTTSFSCADKSASVVIAHSEQSVLLTPGPEFTHTLQCANRPKAKS